MSAGCSVRCPQRILAFVIWISFVIPHSAFIICAMIRCGIGYDIHRLVEGRKLVLGGVEIPYSRGLEGHSDADVLAHAIADAIATLDSNVSVKATTNEKLGAIGRGEGIAAIAIATVELG